jgi:UPF0755 protein
MSLSDVVPGAPHGPRRRSERAAEKRRKKRRRRTWVTVLIMVSVLGGGGAAAYFTLKPLLASFNAPKDFAGPGHGSVSVSIPEGATGKDIASILAKAGVVKTASAYLAAAADTPGSSGIQPGTYELKLEMSGQGAVESLLDPQGRLLKRVTIPEGTRLSVIFDKIAASTSITKAQLTAAAKDTTALGLPAEAHGNLEGYLWPATYDVEPTTTPADLLHEMVDHTNAQLDELGVAEKDRHRVLTLASLAQAEGRHPEDFGKIARVLVNRLAKGTNLELDTTLHYATGKFTVFTSTKDTRFPSPYNTYLHAGLPPGPIDSPGLEALKAALAPTPGPWLFFVATNPSTGETKFAVTEAERQKLLAEYNAWQKAHPGQ